MRRPFPHGKLRSLAAYLFSQSTSLVCERGEQTTRSCPARKQEYERAKQGENGKTKSEKTKSFFFQFLFFFLSPSFSERGRFFLSEFIVFSVCSTSDPPQKKKKTRAFPLSFRARFYRCLHRCDAGADLHYKTPCRYASDREAEREREREAQRRNKLNCRTKRDRSRERGKKETLPRRLFPPFPTHPPPHAHQLKQNRSQEAQARLQRALVVAKHATAAANEATAAVEAASAAAAASAATAECYARAAGVPLSATLGGDGDPFVISARAAARAARLARVEVEAASEAARAAIEAAAKRAAAVVVGPGGGSDGGGGKGRELALVEGEGGGGGDDDDDEGDYGNGFVDLVGNGDRDREGGAVHVEDEEEDDDGDDDGDDYGKRRRKTTAATTNANSSKRTRQHQQQFTASSPPPPPRPVGKETAAAVTRAANGDDDPAAPPGRRLLNGAGNGVYFDGGDGSKVRFRVSVTVAIPEEAAARLGLPVDDGDRRLVESPSSKSMPLVFIERAKFEESTFVYGENKKATPLSPSALAKARAYPPGEKRAQMLKKLFFPLTTVSQSSEFVYRGTHRACVSRFFTSPRLFRFS